MAVSCPALQLIGSLFVGAAGSMCDAFAIIQGSMNNNQKREQVQVRPSSVILSKIFCI